MKAGLFRNVVKRVRGLSLLPDSIALVSFSDECQFVHGEARRMTPARTSVWPLLLAFVLLTAVPALADQPTLPAGVPNLLDPGVRAHFQAEGVADLDGNPDFPLLLLRNTDGGQPQALLVGLDARNGKETWSLADDPIILIMLFSPQSTHPGVYVDAGFVDLGRASGKYAAVGEETLPALPDLLEAVTAPEPGSDSLREASPPPPVTEHWSNPRTNI